MSGLSTGHAGPIRVETGVEPARPIPQSPCSAEFSHQDRILRKGLSVRSMCIRSFPRKIYPPQSKAVPKKFCDLKSLLYLCTAFEQRIELWCNGNTSDFGSEILGSNPDSSTRENGLAYASPFSLFCSTSSPSDQERVERKLVGRNESPPRRPHPPDA